MLHKLTLLASALLCLILISQASAWAGPATGSPCLFQGWPSDFSDLSPDPTLSRGRLANGLRYVLKQNAEPKDRVVLHLLVKAGSFNETEEQRGVAHFLEHMMFNGTEHFPPGTLIDYFQSIGMEFGDDTNAFTSNDRTVYTVVLPDSSKETLDSGILVLSDFAGRALLSEEEIDKERGVILAEKRDRNSAEYKSNIASTRNAFAGTLLPKREVIGTDKVLRRADRTTLSSFYDTWYRPDNMVLVVVGDFDQAKIGALIRKHFGDLKPRTSQNNPDRLPSCADFGAVGERERQPFYYHDKELGRTMVSIENFSDKKAEHDSVALQREQLLQHLGVQILNYRLESMDESADTPFSSSAYYAGDIFDRIAYTTISATPKPGKWRDSLVAIEKIRRQALQFGFSDDELDRAATQIMTQLRKNVQTAQTEDSRQIASDIVDQLASDRVLMSPQQELDLYGAMLKKITTADVNDRFRRDWQRRNLLVSVVGDSEIPGDAQKIISKCYNEAEITELAPPPQYAKITFPYLPVVAAQVIPKAESLTVGNAGRDAGPSQNLPYTVTTYDRIGVSRYVFPNGLVLNLKQTNFEEHQIRLAAVFGSGELSEPKPGMALLAERIINESGTARLTQSELDRLTAGAAVNLGFDIAESSFVWSGQAQRNDIELLVQLLYTLLYDHGFRENIYNRAQTELEAIYSRLGQDVDGAFSLHIQRFLAGGSKRFGLPDYEQLSSISFHELDQWVKSFTDVRDLEISVVGDFDKDQIVRLLGHYFGGNSLQSPGSIKPPKVQFPAGKKLNIDIPTTFDKSLLTFAWPTDDGTDIHRLRRLQVLAAILENRLLEKLRESLGATYSPEAYSYASRLFPHYGYILAETTVAPKDGERVVKEVRALAADIAQNGITEAELIRARDPQLTSIREHIESNDYWLQSVLVRSSRYPQQLQWPETIKSDYSAINTQEMNRLAKTVFRDDLVAIAVAGPAQQPGQKSKVKRQTEQR